MKIVIAPNAFKESLSNLEVANAIEAGVLKAFPAAKTVKLPLSDGGDGLISTFQNLRGGELISVSVADPIGRPRNTHYLKLGDKTAVVETALTSGLALIPIEQRNPLKTTTMGLGETIRHAIANGCRRFIIGLGGSATVDGGVGMAAALGFNFLSKNGSPIYPSGENLCKITEIDLKNPFPELEDCEFQVVCDVENPLLGVNGAAAVFGPQKGASKSDVIILENNLRYLSNLLKKNIDTDHSMDKGSGAAGGLGFMFKSLLKAQLVPGSELILRESGFQKEIENADLVFTAEGALDSQSVQGKIPGAVGLVCLASKTPVIALGGALRDGWESLLKKGITACFAISPGPITLAESMEQATELLQKSSEQVCRVFFSKNPSI